MLYINTPKIIEKKLLDLLKHLAAHGEKSLRKGVETCKKQLKDEFWKIVEDNYSEYELEFFEEYSRRNKKNWLLKKENTGTESTRTGVSNSIPHLKKQLDIQNSFENHPEKKLNSPTTFLIKNKHLQDSSNSTQRFYRKAVLPVPIEENKNYKKLFQKNIRNSEDKRTQSQFRSSNNNHVEPTFLDKNKLIEKRSSRNETHIYESSNKSGEIFRKLNKPINNSSLRSYPFFEKFIEAKINQIYEENKVVENSEEEDFSDFESNRTDLYKLETLNSLNSSPVRGVRKMQLTPESSLSNSRTLPIKQNLRKKYDEAMKRREIHSEKEYKIPRVANGVVKLRKEEKVFGNSFRKELQVRMKAYYKDVQNRLQSRADGKKILNLNSSSQESISRHPSKLINKLRR